MIPDQELQRLFKAESDEHLAALDDGLLRLEKTPADPVLLDEVFRRAHSLKGAARMLRLGRVEATAHGLETILGAARRGEAPITTEVIERMNGGLAELRRQVQEALAEEPQPATEPAPTAASAGTVPPASEAPPAAPTPEPAAPEPPHPAALSAAPLRLETVRVATQALDDLLTQVGELSVIQGRTRHRLALLETLREQWAALERARRDHRADRGPRGESADARASRFGELLRQAREGLADDGARLESTVGRLEDRVRHIRLLPLATVFAPFARMVRDLAREQGKEAELVVEGGDITVDKRVLEEMKDPLMHLLRNAVDHGIEPPAERERLGKPRGGAVRLRAMRENAVVLLEVQDDGRGLDVDSIRREARRRGLHDDATLAAMTPAQIQQLIFLPGFSTSGHVTELSGRGVGLDVVRVNVERMKGAIHLESAAGAGLSVQLRLPVSLGTAQLLLTGVAGHRYGLPIEFVHSSRRVQEREIFALEGRPAVMLDSGPVMVARLADLLELSADTPAAPAPLACTVLQVGDDRLGLLTDELLAEEEVVPKPLGAPLKRVRNVAALAVLGSGEICPVLNPADLLRSARKKGGTSVTEASTRQHAEAKPAVLLVEDSALIRAMEQRILADAGYEVVAAVDGVDALNALGSRPFAAVVSDIVMPNMDGLALTARIRAEPRYQELPVILVTTLASDADKRRGLDVGANAYIAKPAFDQRLLLEALKRLIVT